MTDIHVTATGRLIFGTLDVPCALGKSGVVPAAQKREGDLATPAGTWPLRRLHYRPDRFDQAPRTVLPVHAMAPTDGWCDAPDDPLYNRPVPLPHPTSTESMWRDDHLYDLVVELGYNDAPPVPGKGSAIFFHLARENYLPTEGCVAVTRADMERILAAVSSDTTMTITLS